MIPNFEQNQFSLTARNFYRVGHDSFKLTEWMAFFDKSHEKINYFESMASAL